MAVKSSFLRLTSYYLPCTTYLVLLPIYYLLQVRKWHKAVPHSTYYLHASKPHFKRTRYYRTIYLAEAGNACVCIAQSTSVYPLAKLGNDLQSVDRIQAFKHPSIQR